LARQLALNQQIPGSNPGPAAYVEVAEQGRRAGPRRRCPNGLVGSTPTFDTCLEACVQLVARRPAKPWPFGVSEFESLRFRRGEVVEMVDRPASSPGARKSVSVQIRPSPLSRRSSIGQSKGPLSPGLGVRVSPAALSGRSAVGQRAAFGTLRPSVQIRPPRPVGV
jgi:hypothetical protein